MCNTIYISTDSERDLSTLSSDQFSFQKASEAELRSLGDSLRYPYRWYLASQYGGCSCHYRHLMVENADLGFGKPEAWFPEDEDDVASTQAVYDALASLVREGYRVDVIDLWNTYVPAEIGQVVVDLRLVSRDAFRFWEGYRFEITQT